MSLAGSNPALSVLPFTPRWELSFEYGKSICRPAHRLSELVNVSCSTDQGTSQVDHRSFRQVCNQAERASRGAPGHNRISRLVGYSGRYIANLNRLRGLISGWDNRILRHLDDGNSYQAIGVFCMSSL